MMLCDKLDKGNLASFSAVCGNKWIAEEKYDGDRIRLHFKGGNLTLISRGKSGDVTYRYPEVDFKCDSDVVLDGEMCVMDKNGLSQFNEGIAFRTHCQSPDAILNGMQNYPVTYVVFDILEIDGEDLRSAPWHERRKELEGLEFQSKHIQIAPYSTDITGLWKSVTDRGGEGIILKAVDSPYMEDKRSSFWKKVKDVKEVDLVFSKFTANPKGIRVETDDGIACQVSGYQAVPVEQELALKGKATLTIRYLGITKDKKYRQPTFCKLVEVI